jgi:hypothetical protein
MNGPRRVRSDRGFAVPTCDDDDVAVGVPQPHLPMAAQGFESELTNGSSEDGV